MEVPSAGGYGAPAMALEIEELKMLWLDLKAKVDLLASERAQYAEVFEQASEAYVVTDAAGTIEAANGAAVDILQRRRSALHGKPLAALVALDRRRDFRERLAKLAPGDAWSTVFEAQGERIDVTLCTRLIGGPAEPRGICWRLQAAQE